MAGVILPDHLHAIWILPDDDADFSTRWKRIKIAFTKSFLAAGGVEAEHSASRVKRNARGVWQRRFWEHLIRDADDFRRHVEYIHFNPVKHGLARCPHACRHSSFHQWVGRGDSRADWCCVCDAPRPPLPDFTWTTPEME